MTNVQPSHSSTGVSRILRLVLMQQEVSAFILEGRQPRVLLGKVAGLCIYRPQGSSRFRTLCKGIRPQENTPPNQGFHVSGDEYKHGKPLVLNLK